MDISVIISIACSVLMIAGAGLSYYFYLKAKITNAAIDAINTAEDTDKVKEEKMAIAIDEIKKIIPSAIKPFITDSMIEAIIQHSFDKIEEFAKKQK